MIQRPNPQFGFVAGQRGHVNTVRRRVKLPQFLSVPGQQSALPGADQQPSRAQREQRRHIPGGGLHRTDLAKLVAVEGQHAFARGRDQQLRLARVGQGAHPHRAQRRCGQVEAGAIDMVECAVGRIGIQAGWTRQVKPPRERRRPFEDCRGAHGFKAGVGLGAHRAHLHRQPLPRRQRLLRAAKRSLRPPDYQPNRRQTQNGRRDCENRQRPSIEFHGEFFLSGRMTVTQLRRKRK